MSRRENVGQPMNHGSVFISTTTTTGGGGGTSNPLFDGEPLNEICATVDGVPMWVTPFLVVSAEAPSQRTTIYLDSAGQQLSGVVVPVDPENCSNCT